MTASPIDNWEPQHLAFARAHLWAVLATGRADGSPQQSMVGYLVDDEGRLLISAKAYTAKWTNAVRQPRVSLTVADGRIHLVVYGEVEPIDADPLRAELTAQIFGRLSGNPAPDPSAIVPMLDEQQRVVLRITPTKFVFRE
jgi:PPOX class probable F420-dependent enzyme